jgi:hypothetical protein
MVNPRRWRGLAPMPLSTSCAIFLLAGCSVLVEPSRTQCSTAEDCRNRGADYANFVCIEQICEPNPAWSCLGQKAPPASTSGATVTVTLHLTDIITEQPVAGVSARVCHKMDTDCQQPITTGLQSDSLGRIVAQVPSGFDGFVDVLPTGAMPGSYFIYPPVITDRDVPYIPIIQVASLGTFAQLAGATLLPDRGNVFLGARDCTDAPAQGIQLTAAGADAATIPFYLVKRIPSTHATATDTDGYGGMLNVRPGSATISGVLPSGQVMGTVAVFAKAAWLTYTTLVP